MPFFNHHSTSGQCVQIYEWEPALKCSWAGQTRHPLVTCEVSQLNSWELLPLAKLNFFSCIFRLFALSYGHWGDLSRATWHPTVVTMTHPSSKWGNHSVISYVTLSRTTGEGWGMESEPGECLPFTGMKAKSIFSKFSHSGNGRQTHSSQGSAVRKGDRAERGWEKWEADRLQGVLVEAGRSGWLGEDSLSFWSSPILIKEFHLCRLCLA